MMARINSRPQRPAANTATSREMPMMIFAVNTASSMAMMAWSATALFSRRMSLSFTRPAVQIGVSCSLNSLMACVSSLR
ncbi:hypothetical protein D3C87_1937860 [compost metagenome]